MCGSECIYWIQAHLANQKRAKYVEKVIRLLYFHVVYLAQCTHTHTCTQKARQFFDVLDGWMLNAECFLRGHIEVNK